MRGTFKTGSEHEARLGCASLVAAGDRLRMADGMV